MNYIIFDLELNSKIFKSKLPNEIIEIGAVKLNSDLEIVGEFQEFIKPKVFRKLFPVVKRKTNINQVDVDSADNFKEVLTRFKEWIGNEYLLCCWGHDDIHHLRANCKFNRRGANWLRSYFDIQKQFSKLFDFPDGNRASLKSALDILSIAVEEDLHRADVDAKYTAKIFVQIFDKLNFNANKEKLSEVGSEL